MTTDEGSIDADAVIVATGAAVAGQLLKNVDQSLAGGLSTITAASSAIVVLAVDRKQFRFPLATDFGGYGIICPHVLGRQAIACSFSSNKFSNRAPDGKMLVRCFIGGALQAELVDRSDAELIRNRDVGVTALVGTGGGCRVGEVLSLAKLHATIHVGSLRSSVADRATRRRTSWAGVSREQLSGCRYSGLR